MSEWHEDGWMIEVNRVDGTGRGTITAVEKWWSVNVEKWWSVNAEKWWSVN